MKISRGGTKAPIATDWVTHANIQWDGTNGTNIITTGHIIIPFDSLPDFLPSVVEVQFAHQVTGGTGSCSTFVKQFFGNILAAGSGNYGDSYTGIVAVATAARSRRIFINADVFLSAYTQTTADALRLQVSSYGGSAATEWLVSNIQARLIYVPL